MMIGTPIFHRTPLEFWLMWPPHMAPFDDNTIVQKEKSQSLAETNKILLRRRLSCSQRPCYRSNKISLSLLLTNQLPIK